MKRASEIARALPPAQQALLIGDPDTTVTELAPQGRCSRCQRAFAKPAEYMFAAGGVKVCRSYKSCRQNRGAE